MRIAYLRDHLNGDVLNTGMNLVWRVVSGPITLLLVPLFTSPQTQGFWYTFVSLGALTTMADLGFTGIVTQFVAHEFAFLTFDKNGAIEGDNGHLRSLGALLKFVQRWAVLSGLLMVALVFGIGLWLFGQRGQVAYWFLPWCLFSGGTMVNYWSIILGAFVQGTGQVARTQRIILICRMSQSVVLYSLLVRHAGLLSLALSTLLGGSLLLISLGARYGKALRQLTVLRSTRKWGRDVLSLLWRYAISWAGGYLNTQLFTPFAFYFQGAVAAGRIGITIAIWNAVFSFSSTWLSANVPKINSRIARKDETGVHEFVRDLVGLMLITFIVSAGLVLAVVYGGAALNVGVLTKIAARLLNIRSALPLVASSTIGLITLGMVVYVRAHKEDPFYLPQITGGAATALLSLVILQHFGTDRVFVALLVSTVAVFPWILRVYIRRSSYWRSKAPV